MRRRILVDRARARRMAKRSGRWARVTLDDGVKIGSPVNVDVLDLDAALTRLAAFDPRKCQLADLRFFGGLSLEEAGEALGIAVLEAGLSQLKSFPARVNVETSEGDTFERLSTILNELRRDRAQMAPAFLFVDPYGFTIPAPAWRLDESRSSRAVHQRDVA